MGFYRQVIIFLKKDFLLEWKYKSSLNGILLYVASTIFVCYLSFKQIVSDNTWVALFWIIILFVTTNATSRSFDYDTGGREIYLYSLVPPQVIITAKIIYNLIISMIISFFSLMTYSLVLGSFPGNTFIFLLIVLTGSMGLSAIQTLIAGITTKIKNNSTLMVVLSFPILLPLLISLLDITKACIRQNTDYKLFVVLIALNIITFTLSYILFPFIWKE